MSRLSTNDISIEFTIALIKLLSFKITASVNNHGYLEYTGIISNAEAERVKKELFKSTNIRVTTNNEVIFNGFPLTVSVKEENEAYILHIKAASYTQIFSYHKHSHFYQDKKQSFSDVIKKAVEKENGSCIATKGSKQIGDAILQYEETPWAFSLRVAGKIATVITPNITIDSPQICLGIPNGRSYVIEKNKMIKKHNSLQKTKNKILNDAKNVGDYLTFHFEDEKILTLGDRVEIDAENLPITHLCYELEKDALINNYVLGEEDPFVSPVRRNLNQAGLILQGSVIAVSGQEIKVCLDIPDDAETNPKSASWFDFAPVTNNGMYAMPPKGTRIALEWLGNKDGDAKAVNTVRDGAELSEYAYRSLVTEYKKQMSMTPKRVAFTSDSNNISLRNGIRMNTEKMLKLTAQREIRMVSKKRLRVKTPEQVFITKTGVESGILMGIREIDIKSSEVSMDSNAQTDVVPLPLREPLKKVTLKNTVVSALSSSTPKF